MDDLEAPPPSVETPAGGPSFSPAPRPEARLGLPGDVDSDAGAVRPGGAARPARLLLGLATLVVIGLGVWLLATQTDLWASGYRGRRRAELRQQRDEVRARAHARVGEPRYGTLRVLGAPPGAAVYVALGHTPLAAPHLDTGQSHRVLLEAQGYVPRRLTVAPSAWRAAATDAGLPPPDAEEAEATATLLAGYAPLGDDEDFAGSGPGSGRTGTLRLQSTPPAASAWLLVGYTPVARIEDVRLDRSYDLMVHKAGYVAARATIPGAAFRAGPAGPEHEVTVALRALPSPPGRRP